jgi:hypothetical protein
VVLGLEQDHLVGLDLTDHPAELFKDSHKFLRGFAKHRCVGVLDVTAVEGPVRGNREIGALWTAIHS